MSSIYLLTLTVPCSQPSLRIVESTEEARMQYAASAVKLFVIGFFQSQDIVTDIPWDVSGESYPLTPFGQFHSAADHMRG